MIKTASTSLALIASGAYVGMEIAAEYGNIPPAFLPFGHGRLFECQVRALQSCSDRLVLTVPDSYQIDASDAAWLDAHGVEVLLTSADISLSESIASALVQCGEIQELTLLHGDTLIWDAPVGEFDVVAVAPAPRGYQWGQFVGKDSSNGRAEFTSPDTQSDVLAGWFSFSKPEALAHCLRKSPDDFVKALELYRDTVGLSIRTVQEWLDFGHLQTFHRSRTKVNTARSFNNVSIDRRTVTKSGRNIDKIDAEALWFEKLPPQMRLFTPAFLGRTDQGYRIAYEFSPTLHELFIFSALGPRAWAEIADECMGFLKTCATYTGPTGDGHSQAVIETLALRKTNVRLSAWAGDAGIDLDMQWELNGASLPSLRQITAQANDLVFQSDPIPGIMHGDFCFPNMFYNFRQQTIKVIDPRGSVIDGTPSIYGDLRYDLAKLNHSVQGYDAILTDRFRLKRSTPYAFEFHLAENQAKQNFMESVAAHNLQGQRISDPAIQALTVLLFLSMLPLHADRPDRQQAFLANALRIYQRIEI